jgi:ABC-type sugar transport system ATPase subunit
MPDPAAATRSCRCAIRKSFAPKKVVDTANENLRRPEFHELIGKNGAGK